MTEILKTVENVMKTLKDMKIVENLDIGKLMKMVQMMNALNKGKVKGKNKIKIKVKTKKAKL